ncbi:hypothetical protein Tco_0497530 [Tanacetum coccineum]
MKELWEAKKILSMEIVRDQSHKIMRVSQSRYVSMVLNNFRIENGKSVQMPLDRHFKPLLKDFPFRDRHVERMSKVLYEFWEHNLLDGGHEARHTIYDHGNHVDITSFVNSDYANDLDKSRVVTGYAEHMALIEAMKEVILVKGALGRVVHGA